MPTLVSEAIEDTRRHLYGTSRLELNRLQTSIGTSDVSVTAEFDLRGISQGSFISIDDEMMYVLSSNPATKVATVIRGYLGTVAAAHTNGAIIEVNPRFPKEMIREALKREINSYAPRLFRVTAHEITTTADSTSFDMPTSDYLHVLSVRGKSTGSTTRPSVLRWTDLREQNLTDFPSGAALLLHQAVSVGAVLRLMLARRFVTTTFTDSTDLEATVGMTESMVDIPSIGAAYRLLSTREIPRTNLAAQPEPRRAEEVPPGHMTSVVTSLKRMRDERIAEESFALREKYPIRRG